MIYINIYMPHKERTEFWAAQTIPEHDQPPHSKALFPFFQRPCLSISQSLAVFLSVSLCHSADQRGAHYIEIS